MNKIAESRVSRHLKNVEFPEKYKICAQDQEFMCNHKKLKYIQLAARTQFVHCHEQQIVILPARIRLWCDENFSMLRHVSMWIFKKY